MDEIPSYSWAMDGRLEEMAETIKAEYAGYVDAIMESDKISIELKEQFLNKLMVHSFGVYMASIAPVLRGAVLRDHRGE